MKVSDIYRTKYLAAYDLKRQPLQVTINGARVEPLPDRTEDRIVVTFEETTRPLLLNVTNARTIADIHGDETDGWLGKQIILYTTQTRMKGEVLDCIRVNPPLPDPIKETAATPCSNN